MKAKPRFSILLVGIWSSLCFQTVSGSFGLLFGGGRCSEGSREDNLVCQIHQIYQSAGIKNNYEGIVDSNAVEQGKRALDCMASVSGLDLDEKLGPIGFAKNIVFEYFFKSLNESPGRVDRLCQVVQKRRRLQRQLMEQVEEQQDKDIEQKGSQLRRRLGTPASVDYPSDMSSSYSTWAETNVATYLVNTENSEQQRADVGQVTELILDPVIEVRQTIVDSGLLVARDAMEVVCMVVGSVELGFDPGDACRIISTSIDLAITVSETAQLELENELLIVTTHNALIDSAEVHAIHTDAATLVTSLTR